MTDTSAFLDTRTARLVAGLVGLLALAFLALANQPGIFGGISSTAGIDPRVEECKAERKAQIDKLVADGVLDKSKAEDYTARAIATCEAAPNR